MRRDSGTLEGPWDVRWGEAAWSSWPVPKKVQNCFSLTDFPCTTFMRYLENNLEALISVFPLQGPAMRKGFVRMEKCNYRLDR